MKTTLLICLAVVLVGCTGCSHSSDQLPGNKDGTDSPIVISDGSTHFRHSGTTGDFLIAPNGGFDQATVADSGFTVKKNGAKCFDTDVCPEDFMNNLQAPDPQHPWTIVVNSKNGTQVMTVTCADNMTVVSQFAVNNVFTSVDPTSDSTDTNGKKGSDLAWNVDDFGSAVFTDGVVGSQAETITCTVHPGCKLKIKYHNP